MKRIVVYGSDGNDVQYMLPSIYSVKKFMPDAEIYVLSDMLDPDEVYGAKIIDPAEMLSDLGFFSDGWARKWPYATLYRMVIPLLKEFEDVDRVLYLDTDTIVLSPQIGDLFSLDVHGAEIVAAKDSNGTWERIDGCVRSDLCLEGLSHIVSRLWVTRHINEMTYCNAGVSLWCVKNIRGNGLDWYRQRLKWFWEAELRGKFKYLDQDFMNSMMVVDASLGRKFNAFADMAIPDDVVIKHFVAHTKDQIIPTAEKLGYKDESTYPGGVVVYSSDGKDKDRLKLSIASVRKFIGPDVKIYILTELDKYPEVPEAVLINPMPTLRQVGFFPDGWNRHWPFSCLFRLAIPLLDEFKDVDRILYLDTDVLVRSKDAIELMKLESNGFEAYGVQDIEARQNDIPRIMRHELSSAARSEMRRRLWKKRSKVMQGYINSGVLVEFLGQIRENGLDWYRQRLKWFWEAELQGKFRFPDQDFINVMMDVNPSLSVKYNRFVGDYGTNCVMQHFVGRNKNYMLEVARRMGI